MNLRNRLAQLEKIHNPQPAARVQVNYPPGYYERAMQALADALADITGQPVAPAEVTEAISHE